MTTFSRMFYRMQWDAQAAVYEAADNAAQITAPAAWFGRKGFPPAVRLTFTDAEKALPRGKRMAK